MTEVETVWQSSPELVEVTRGGFVESRHRGAIAVSDAAGRLVLSRGDVARPVFARSAIKPLQALPLVESGAAERYGLGNCELALACASHHGEPNQVAVVRAWLDRIGFAVDDLECGSHQPYAVDAAYDLARSGTAPCALHNNCSGKHAGFLTTARHLGEASRGYVEAGHPVQQRVMQVLEDMAGLSLAGAPRGVDGCGIPVIAMPLAAIARAMARVGDPRGLSATRQAACGRILAAIAAEPVMTDGSGGFAARLMKALGGRACVKLGAEGMACAILPELGYGVAIKIEDGAGRAAEVAMGAVLRRLGIFDEARQPSLPDFIRPPLRNAAGREVGTLRPAETLVV